MNPDAIAFVSFVIGVFVALGAALAYGQWASTPAMRKGAYRPLGVPKRSTAWRGRKAALARH